MCRLFEFALEPLQNIETDGALAHAPKSSRRQKTGGEPGLRFERGDPGRWRRGNFFLTGAPENPDKTRCFGKQQLRQKNGMAAEHHPITCKCAPRGTQVGRQSRRSHIKRAQGFAKLVCDAACHGGEGGGGTRFCVSGASQRQQVTRLLQATPAARADLQQAHDMIDAVGWMLGVHDPRTFLVQTMDRSELVRNPISAIRSHAEAVHLRTPATNVVRIRSVPSGQLAVVLPPSGWRT